LEQRTGLDFFSPELWLAMFSIPVWQLVQELLP